MSKNLPTLYYKDIISLNVNPTWVVNSNNVPHYLFEVNDISNYSTINQVTQITQSRDTCENFFTVKNTGGVILRLYVGSNMDSYIALNVINRVYFSKKKISKETVENIKKFYKLQLLA